MTRPEAQRFMAHAAEIWERTIATKTPEQIAAMKAENERQRQLRQRMFGGRVRPVVESETQRLQRENGSLG